LVEKHPISVKNFGGKRFKVKYASMIKSNPPTFLMFSNRSKGIPENYRKYLTKSIRSEFNLINTPVHLIFRTRSEIAKRIKRANPSNGK
jgi:GTP-binding protein